MGREREFKDPPDEIVEILNRFSKKDRNQREYIRIECSVFAETFRMEIVFFFSSFRDV